jgi:hypothetical protein
LELTEKLGRVPLASSSKELANKLDYGREKRLVDHAKPPNANEIIEVEQITPAYAVEAGKLQSG